MLLNDMQAKELILDDAGAVVGVKALYDGEQEVTVNCGAVVIATGGFGGNVEYRQKVNTGVWKEVVLDDSIGCTNIKPCAQGEGMVLARTPAPSSSACPTSSCTPAAPRARASWRTSAPPAATVSS